MYGIIAPLFACF